MINSLTLKGIPASAAIFLHFSIDSLKVGDETRTVASGIAEWYKPEELVGKNVVLVYNPKPAKLCGVESQGMILCAEKDGKLSIVSPEKGEIPDGATVR